jgi:nucleotide-binding universal stress UspA family protein
LVSDVYILEGREEKPMYQTILVPLDGSELAECVLPHVEILALGCQVKKVIFARVVEPFHQPTGDYILDEEQVKKFESEHKAVAQDYLRKIPDRVKLTQGVQVQSEILHGRVADTLADYASRHPVDLIVIATHGRSGVSRWVWGSVADRILRSACVPVLMVRAPGCVPGL